MTAVLSEIECVTVERRAAVLLDPLRLRILREARAPASATEIAARLGMPRQKVNYHVRALAQARFLRRAGQQRKRNLIERRYQATARAYVLSPEILGPLRADARQVADAFSAAYLLALTSQSQAELGRAIAAAHRQGKPLATWSVSAEMRFESAAQRAGFAHALEQAIAVVMGRHASPATLSGGAAGPGRPYRLILGCYPIPPEQDLKKEQA